jgi:hypothetical protein
MATWANECRAAALNGITALLNSGSFRVLTSADLELAAPTFASTAFGSATTANPSVATAASLTADTSITAGTFTKFEMRTSSAATRISGSVGVGSGDIQVADNVIPSTATSFNISGLTISLTLS